MPTAEAVVRDKNVIEIPSEMLDRLDLSVGSTFQLTEEHGCITLRPVTRTEMTRPERTPSKSVDEMIAFFRTLPKMTGAEEELYEERKRW